MTHLETVIGWLAGIGVAFAAIVATRWKFTEMRENRRGWRLSVVAPFFRYQAKDSRGEWAAIDFEATREWSGHGGRILKAVHIPSPTDWFTSPEWVVSRRDEIIAHLKEAYPSGVDFIEKKPDESPP